MESEAHDPRRRGRLNVQGKRLTEYAPWALAHEASSVLSSEQAVTCPLFLKIPTIEDVAQGGIGDCAYLATVMAILSLDEGPLIVHHMMRDLPPFGPSTDPCVVVRLFDFNKQPYYLKLPRTIITSWLPKSIAPQFHANVLPKSGAWPIFLEKALTAFDDEGCFAPGATPRPSTRPTPGSAGHTTRGRCANRPPGGGPGPAGLRRARGGGVKLVCLEGRQKRSRSL